MGNLFKESLNKVKAQEIFANERPDLHFQIRKIDSQQLGALCPVPYMAKSASAIRLLLFSALQLSISIPPARRACTASCPVHRMTRELQSHHYLRLFDLRGLLQMVWEREASPPRPCQRSWESCRVETPGGCSTWRSAVRQWP